MNVDPLRPLDTDAESDPGRPGMVLVWLGVALLVVGAVLLWAWLR